MYMNFCLKYPIQCPNAIYNAVIPRENINEHRKTCQYEMVNCSNGCGLELQQQHLNNACQRSADMEQSNVSIAA